MPLVNGKYETPDAAMAAGLCPECGQDLTKSNPIAHFKSHWTTTPPRDSRGKEATRRMAMFQDFITKNKVRTSNMPAPKAPAAPVAEAKPAPLP